MPLDDLLIPGHLVIGRLDFQLADRAPTKLVRAIDGYDAADLAEAMQAVNDAAVAVEPAHLPNGMTHETSAQWGQPKFRSAIAAPQIH